MACGRVRVRTSATNTLLGARSLWVGTPPRILAEGAEADMTESRGASWGWRAAVDEKETAYLAPKSFLPCVSAAQQSQHALPHAPRFASRKHNKSMEWRCPHEPRAAMSSPPGLKRSGTADQRCGIRPGTELAPESPGAVPRSSLKYVKKTTRCWNWLQPKAMSL